MIPSILGIFVLLWGLLSVKYDRPTLDICNSTSSYLMCPRIVKENYMLIFSFFLISVLLGSTNLLVFK
jgi:hypothetical protein